MNEAVIVAYGRSAIGKATKGALKDTRPEDFAAQVISGVLAKVPEFDSAHLDDFILGTAFPEAEQGINLGRIVALRAGLPVNVPAQTVNRFCASGLQSIASAANSIMAGQASAVLAGGVESMTAIPMGGNIFLPNPELISNGSDAYMSMGLTAENVADAYAISRELQDEFAMKSHEKAAKAQESGLFEDEIIQVDSVALSKDEDGVPIRTVRTFDQDEGIRPGISLDQLAKLQPVFKRGGSVTAGNASQMSDGAAGVLLLSRAKADKLGLKPLARFVSYGVSGVNPAVMGIGPIHAIPKALSIAGINLSDLGLIELNEAFASQSIAIIRELGLDESTVNVNGGAIALGHPLGCTGSLLTSKLLSEMRRRDTRYGLVSMCIGGGMGAAAIFELLN